MRHRAVGMTVAVLVGILAFLAVAASDGNGMVSPRGVVWSALFVAPMVLPLAGLAHLFRNDPAVIGLAWAVPIGGLSGVAMAIGSWAVFGGWGPPFGAAMPTAGAAVGVACVFFNRGPIENDLQRGHA